MYEMPDSEMFGYPFDAPQKVLLRSLARWLTGVGLGLLIVGLLNLGWGGYHVFATEGAEAVIGLALVFGAPLACILLPGVWTFRAGRRFAAIPKGDGADVYDVLQAVSHLRGATRLWAFVFLALVAAPILWAAPFAIGLLLGQFFDLVDGVRGSSVGEFLKALGLNAALVLPIAVGVGGEKLVDHFTADPTEGLADADAERYEFTDSATGILESVSTWTQTLAVVLIATCLPVLVIPGLAALGVLGSGNIVGAVGNVMFSLFGLVPWALLVVSAVFCAMTSRTLDAIVRREDVPEMLLLLKALGYMRVAFAIWGGLFVVGGTVVFLQLL